jgi:DNA-binding transcriptional MerR regulator
MEEPRWTLDELAERVDAALAVDYHGQPSGRVRAVPDRRAIRWYTTIGLIDRPVAHRGRTALYGPRHLLQLVAVKRLQAKGLPLVAIQQELAGATDTRLARVARIPVGLRPPARAEPASVAAAPDGDDRSGRVSTEPDPLAPAAPTTAHPQAVAARVTGAAARRAGFWRERPAAFSAAAPEAVQPDATGPAAPASPGVATLQGVRLGDGATLLLEPVRDLDAADLDAIRDAARPLLAALRDRGLGGGSGNPGQRPDPRPGGGTEPRREQP